MSEPTAYATSDKGDEAVMHSRFEFRPTPDDRLVFARKQEVYAKVATTVIAVIVLAIGLAIAVKDDLAEKSATAGPTSEVVGSTSDSRE